MPGEPKGDGSAAIAQLVGDLGRAAVEALGDLRDAVEIMDTKITPFGEREDGTTSQYIVADSTWHRVLAVARGSTSEAARKAIDEHRAAALPPVAPDLDVETLAKAISQHHRRSYIDMIDTSAAKDIAARYRRLRADKGGETA